jgi:sugar/nucleoside kinase (ribokinase family)
LNKTAVRLAKEAGLLVSIDLASYNVVEANLDFLKTIIKEYVDIVFANEEEAKAFTGKEPTDALIHISEHCSIAVVKIGKEGSLVKSGSDHHFIKPFEANCIDTTGAGDLYAAGFLYGMACGFPLDKCGKIGSLVSSNVVEILGAKMTNETWANINSQIKALN